LSTQTLKQALLVLIVVLTVPVFRYTNSQSIPKISLVVSEQVITSIPTRIIIPSIGVDAIIEQVDITQEGLMDVPKDPSNAGWYSLGPIPGEVGSAVIDGHVDGPNGTNAVFTNVHKLQLGNKIVIENNHSELATFVVSRLQEYDPNADATDVFTSQDGLAHLNLITCFGNWDPNINGYTKRLVVFTDKE
jgi:LPXTG-site transpeptidase (sortase) family protein